jgi:predicted RNA-binding Zn-ribbon protein involved in translation (DUF1610 family)
MIEMSVELKSDPMACSNCGASLREGYATCPACGAPVSIADSAAQRREIILNMVGDANQNLVQAGSGAAESAFGLSCSLGTIFGLVLLGFIFLLGFRNWIVLGIIAMGVTLMAAGVSVALAARARSATIAGTYAREVEPKIKNYLQVYHLTQHEFHALANETLDGNAPLRRYLSSPYYGDSVHSENS